MAWLSTGSHLFSKAKNDPEYKAKKQLFEQLPNTTLSRPWFSKHVLDQCEKEVSSMDGCNWFPMPILSKDMDVVFLFASQEEDRSNIIDHKANDSEASEVENAYDEVKVGVFVSPTSDTTLSPTTIDTPTSHQTGSIVNAQKDFMLRSDQIFTKNAGVHLGYSNKRRDMGKRVPEGL